MVKKLLILFAALAIASAAVADDQDGWINLFNGKNLDGWIVKITGHELGENPGNIFRVEDGLLTVSYDAFDDFEKRYGHIFVDRPFTNYRFQVEYRFIGEQIKGGAGWAFRNSGAMLHGQAPETMAVKALFPNSVEFQFLAQNDKNDRVTGSFCTPGTYFDIKGETIKKHVVKSSEQALPLGKWVRAEAIVKGDTMQFFINGNLVNECTNIKKDDGTPVCFGSISLQAESHPVQFRNIRILPFD